MFRFARRLLSKSQTLNTALGSVVHESEKIFSQTGAGFVTVRIKRELDGGYVIGCKFKADMHAGADGSPTNYVYFDANGARQLKHALGDAMERHQSLTGDGGQ